MLPRVREFYGLEHLWDSGPAQVAVATPAVSRAAARRRRRCGGGRRREGPGSSRGRPPGGFPCGRTPAANLAVAATDARARDRRGHAPARLGAQRLRRLPGTDRIPTRRIAG